MGSGIVILAAVVALVGLIGLKFIRTRRKSSICLLLSDSLHVMTFESDQVLRNPMLVSYQSLYIHGAFCT